MLVTKRSLRFGNGNNANFSIDRYTIGNGEIGETTAKIHEIYLELVTGK